MKILSVINLKGGVGKTITAINLAHMLSAAHGKKVLLIDNDKQGNTTKFFSLHDTELASISELLLNDKTQAVSVIKNTRFNNLDLITADMRLHHANKQIMLDMRRQQQTILAKALSSLNKDYDYCIIDNAPDVNISVINALVASHEVIIPAKIDQFTFDGITELVSCFEDIRAFNPGLIFLGVLITMRNKTIVNKDGLEYLKNYSPYPVFESVIRQTTKVPESTFRNMPLLEMSKSSIASKDYLAFVEEYLQITTKELLQNDNEKNQPIK